MARGAPPPRVAERSSVDSRARVSTDVTYPTYQTHLTSFKIGRMKKAFLIAVAAFVTVAGAWPQGQTSTRPQGWAVRERLKGAKLYNTAKQKLLDGKQIY